MQSLFYGAAVAGVAGLALGAGFKTSPQPPAQPQPEAVYAEETPATDNGFQPAYLQGAVYTSAASDWALPDQPSPESPSATSQRSGSRATPVSYAADPPPAGDDIPTPAEPAAQPAQAAPSSTAPGPSTTPTQPQPGAPSQRQDDQDTPASNSSSAAPSGRGRQPIAPTQARPDPAAAPAPGQRSPEAMTPQGPQASFYLGRASAPRLELAGILQAMSRTARPS